MSLEDSVKIVVGLGEVDSEVVQPILGEDYLFVQNPSAQDLDKAQGAIVRAAFIVDEKSLASMPNLRVLARTGVGTDSVDLDAASKRNIPVVITPNSNSTAVAEGVFAHLLHLSKRLGPLTNLVKTGDWDARTSFPVGDLEGQTLGIVGYGRIGQKVAKFADAFGMEVIVYDPFAEVPSTQRKDDIESLVEISDYITLHVPLTEKTKNLFNSELFSKIKTGAILINLGRGPLVDLDAALDAMRSGRLGGLGLDVYDIEPTEFHTIFNEENIVLTPHVMGLSRRSTRATFIDAAQGVRDVLDGRKPRAVANPDN